MDNQNNTVSRVKFCIARGVAIVLGIFLIISILINADTSKRLRIVCSEFSTISNTDSESHLMQDGERAEEICSGQNTEY